MAKPNIVLFHQIKRDERHLRWDWEPSPNRSEDRGLIRYHFVSIDDRNPKGNIERLLKNMQGKSVINHSFEEIENVIGSLRDSDLKYVYNCYDSECTPDYVSFEGVSNRIKKDENLSGRKFILVKDYLERIYGPND
jgi:hypothetical protein